MKLKWPRDWPRLAFTDPQTEFTGGLQTTIRVGVKWLNYFLDGQNSVVLLDPKGKPFALARIRQVVFLPFYGVETSMFQNAAAPSEQSPLTAIHHLQQRYPSFSSEDYVTVLYFTKEPNP